MINIPISKKQRHSSGKCCKEELITKEFLLQQIDQMYNKLRQEMLELIEQKFKNFSSYQEPVTIYAITQQDSTFIHDSSEVARKDTLRNLSDSKPKKPKSLV